LAYGEPGHLPPWVGPMRHGYIRVVDRLLPRMDPELAALLDRAGVGTEAPLCYLDNSFLLNALPLRPGRVLWRQRAWLPTVPFSLFQPLPGERGQVYLSRFTERVHLGGWLVQPNFHGRFPTPQLWFYKGLARTHTPVATYESPHWQVIRFEMRPTLV